MKCLSQLNFHTKKIYDAIWTCTEGTNLDDNTQSIQNTYFNVNNSDDDNDYKDEIHSTSLIITKTINGVGAANIVNNLDVDKAQPMIVQKVDQNIGVYVGQQLNDCPTINEHVGPTVDVGANVEKAGPSDESTKQKIKLTKDESRFLVTVMTEEEMRQTRQSDRDVKRFNIAPYKCETCIKAYFNEKRYQKHMNDNHTEGAGKHKCSICSIFLTRRDALEQHRAMHYHKYACRICDYQDHRLATMLIHNQRTHEARVYSCDMCDKEYSIPRSLRYHKEAVHNERTVCKICYKSFPKSRFKEHMLSHNKAKVPCQDCGKLYKETSLRAHRKIHTRRMNESAYCAECDIYFKDNSLYKRHLTKSLKHHGGDVKFICDYCKKVYSDKHNLAVHIACVHTLKFWHTCRVCDKGFMGKSKLKMHVLEKHEGYERAKDKLCPYCGKGFKDASVLTNHIRRHTGERPHQCVYCPAAFAQRSPMITHCRALHPGLPIPPSKRGR